MWVLLKIIFSVFAFFYRLENRRHLAGKRGIRHGRSGEARAYELDGIQCQVVAHRRRRGSPTQSTTFYVPLRTSAIFRLSRESSWDQLFKSLGLAVEVQTGDVRFDSLVYVTSDSAAFALELRSDAMTRHLALELLQKGATSVSCEGETLVAEFPGDHFAAAHGDTLVKLAKQLADVDRRFVGSRTDHFAAKALFVECLVWGVGTYAAASAFEWYVRKEDIHLKQELLVQRGLLLGVGLAVVMFLGIVMIFRGSSRGRRILVESAVVLCLSLTVGGVGLAADLNTQLDKSAPQVVEREISRVYSVKHQGSGRRGRRTSWYSYHLELLPSAEDSRISPVELSIRYADFVAAEGKTRVQMRVGRGFLRIPWVRGYYFY